MVDYVRDTTDPSLVSAKLERIGFRVGQRLAERYATMRDVRFQDTLEVIKFLCKDFWAGLSGGKHINSLRTNHRGTYALHDQDFYWISSLSDQPTASDASKESSVEEQVVFYCGVLRGALLRFGISSIVTAEAISPPACTFTVRCAEDTE